MIRSSMNFNLKNLLITYFAIFRQEQNSSVNNLLSDLSKQNRRRTHLVNIQISVITWSAEFLTGILMLVSFLLPHSMTVVIILGFFDIILSFVLIPSAYILNTEVVKAIFIRNGWLRSIRSQFVSNRVQPAPNEAAINPKHE